MHRPEDDLHGRHKRFQPFSQVNFDTGKGYKPGLLQYFEPYAEVSYIKNQISAQEKMARAAKKYKDVQNAHILPLHAVVEHRGFVIGMLYRAGNFRFFLNKARLVSADQRCRESWIQDISKSCQWLDKHNIAWKDARIGSILIDNDNRAWICNVGRDPPGEVPVEKWEQNEAKIWRLIYQIRRGGIIKSGKPISHR